MSSLQSESWAELGLAQHRSIEQEHACSEVDLFVGKTYCLEQFKEAILASEEVGRGGKVLLQG